MANHQESLRQMQEEEHELDRDGNVIDASIKKESNQDQPLQMEIGELVFKRSNPEEQVIEMLISEFDGMDKPASEAEAGEEGGEEEMEENVMEAEEIPILPKQEGVHLKYVIHNDKENHPVFDPEPLSMDPSRVYGSDAFIIR
jgi:hypothetical protein